MLRKTVRETKVFNGNGLFRHKAPAGMLIEGHIDGTRFVCGSYIGQPVEIKVGWYVSMQDVAALTDQLPPPPDPNAPDALTIAAHELTIRKMDGSTLGVYSHPETVVRKVA
jgi:hypothetical protein